MKKITILIPVHNEEAVLPQLETRLLENVNKLNTYEWEFLFIDDGSSDGSLAWLRTKHQQDPRFKYLSFSRNFGKEAAMLAGFDAFTGDCLIIIDADLQDPPELIVSMLHDWEEGYDDVYAQRCQRGKESYLRKILTLCYYRLMHYSTRIRLLPNVGDFRLLDRRCVRALQDLREHNRYTKGLFCWIGFRKKGILFDRHDRQLGASSWNFSSLFNLALDGFIGFTAFPLRLAMLSGFAVFLFAFFYGIYVIIKTLCYGDPVAGYPSLMVVIVFLGGAQLFILGVIGEYLSRIFDENKNRPNYIVAEKDGERV
ncbi:MAG: glycosyltransferase family 2 protein [Lentisphaeria bacterium]